MLPSGWSKRRLKRNKGRLERDLPAWMARARAAGTKFWLRVSIRNLVSACLVFLLLITIVLLLSPKSLPRSYTSEPLPPRACSPSTKPFLNDHLYCTGECNTECFPRVRNICFASDRVRVCEDAASSANRRSDLPKFMRFFGEKLTVPVHWDANCNEGWHWVQGLSLVLDQRFLPAGKPNPHHEAEKLIPAILLKQFLNHSANFQWFASQSDVSVWGKGLLTAFNLTDKVRFHTLPIHKDDSICFKDAILFSGPTHVNYVPDFKTNAWLRSRVLDYCDVDPLVRNATWPPCNAVILDRTSGPRQLANKFAAEFLIGQTLMLPHNVWHKTGGIGSFCEQVKTVAFDEFFLVAHGSQNVNFLFAKPGAVVVEVFPYLYYTDAFQNFTHAAGIDVYPLLGARPPDTVFMPLLSNFGWDFCFSMMWCKNYARRQPLQIDLDELEKLIRVVQKQKSSLRAELGW